MLGTLGTDANASFPPTPKPAYVAFPSLHATPLTIAAQFRLPVGAEAPIPAVVIVHGSAGVDGRGAFLAEALNQAGIATLEVDMWAPRGLGGGLGRPRSALETLPDAFGALRYLADRPDVDAANIGIAGFSWGGVVSMLTATRHNIETYLGRGDRPFAAHAPYYPVCWSYNTVPGYDFGELSGAPVFIQAGQLDTYDDPDGCQSLADGLSEQDRAAVSVVTYEGATHAFDRLQPSIRVFDPHANKGTGGEVDFIANPEVAETARRAAARFFRTSFGMSEPATST